MVTVNLKWSHLIVSLQCSYIMPKTPCYSTQVLGVLALFLIYHHIYTLDLFVHLPPHPNPTLGFCSAPFNFVPSPSFLLQSNLLSSTISIPYRYFLITYTSFWGMEVRGQHSGSCIRSYVCVHESQRLTTGAILKKLSTTCWDLWPTTSARSLSWKLQGSCGI